MSIYSDFELGIDKFAIEIVEKNFILFVTGNEIKLGVFSRASTKS